MTQTTAKVSGMACSMCEAQINDTIRTAFPIEKVSSSHSQGETVIHSKEPLNENTLRAAIEATGYTAGEIRAVPYEKKAIFHFWEKTLNLFRCRHSCYRFEMCILTLGGRLL